MHYVWVAPYKYHGGDVEILAILAHEVAHTIDYDVGHRGVFVRATRAIGLVGKPTATDWGPKFLTLAGTVLADLGPYPFSGYHPEKNDHPTPASRSRRRKAKIRPGGPRGPQWHR